MFFKKKNHKLPKFPEDLRSVFKGLSYEFNVSELEQISAAVATVIADLKRQSDNSDNIDSDLIAELERVSHLLIKIYPDRSVEHRCLIAAALRYFVSEDDALDDAAFATGLHDDVRVMNHVLEEIGIDDQYISLI